MEHLGHDLSQLVKIIQRARMCTELLQYFVLAREQLFASVADKN
jgi:hypothetical protein